MSVSFHMMIGVAQASIMWLPVHVGVRAGRDWVMGFRAMSKSVSFCTYRLHSMFEVPMHAACRQVWSC